MNMISPLFFGKADIYLPANQFRETINHTQDEFFFHLALAKSKRVNELKQRFSQSPAKRILICSNLAACDLKRSNPTIELLPSGFFGNDTIPLAKKVEMLDGAIVISLNNDDSLPSNRHQFAELYSSCKNTIFVAWDWDNHHWIDYSIFLAAHSDLYVPAHHENLYLLSRYNQYIAGPVYAATFQWTSKFLNDSLPEIILTERSDEPLGMHIPYSRFSLRMRTIKTLNRSYSKIDFANPSFHKLTPHERLIEWASHKLHWVVPVLNDVPIRVFDALSTGGIPVVPDSMRLLPPISEIDKNHIVFYGPMDIVDPLKLVQAANEKFNRNGTDGIVARHRFALGHHHCNTGIKKILALVAEVFDLQYPR
jgi:hypothetical protein